MMKNWASHILFLRKRELIVYLAAQKRELFSLHIHTMSYIGNTPRREQLSLSDSLPAQINYTKCHKT